jgi:predicted nicotinamide N-methyase
MLNNRERIGVTGINWQQVALGIGKNRRKTIGFGAYDKKSKEYEEELYIKELSIIDGGIGCALWDAAIILSRFIYENSQLFNDKNVLELGAGVGLPGIMAARFAKICYLTDYIETIQENLEYNVRINSTTDDEEPDDERERKKYQHKKNVAKSSKVLLLNWDDIKTQTNPQEQIPLRSVDIILGSELTYTGNENTINCLIEVVLAYLARPGGVFIEVLSDDRDGVSQFLQDSKRLGVEHTRVPVPQHLLGNFGTKQQPETYQLYLFARQEDLAQNILYQQICQIFNSYK